MKKKNSQYTRDITQPVDFVRLIDIVTDTLAETQLDLRAELEAQDTAVLKRCSQCKEWQNYSADLCQSCDDAADARADERNERERI